jgi:hypothetical protein
MRRFIGVVCLTGMCLMLSGCGKSTPTPSAAPAKEHPLGIVSAARDGAMVVLTVVLKDQLKLQLREGDTPGPMCWVEADTPTPIAIELQDGKLSMGVASEKWDTAGVKLKTSFAELARGAREVTIGTREIDGNSVPIVVALIPTTADEQQAIGQGK